MNPLLVLVSAVLFALSPPAWAELSRDDAVSLAQKASNGRVLTVEKSQREGRAVWRVKVVSAQGEVRLILIDAATGRML